MTVLDLVVGLVLLLGVAGVLVPVLPGSSLVLLAVLVWAAATASLPGWLVLAAVTTLLALGVALKYAVPGRRLRGAGVPQRTVVAGGVLGIVGFFVVRVVGLFLGFVLGVYLVEAQRVGPSLAWPSTRSALRAVGLSVLIELAAVLLASATWLAAAIAL